MYHENSPPSPAHKNGLARRGPENGLAEVVRRIRDHDSSGIDDLYRAFSSGLRFLIRRHLDAMQVEDCLRAALADLVRAIEAREPEPDRVIALVRQIAAGNISRRTPAPEPGAASGAREQAEETDRQDDAMGDILDSLSGQEREILRRFYVLRQPESRICADLRLSESELQALKARVRARCDNVGPAETRSRSL